MRKKHKKNPNSEQIKTHSGRPVYIFYLILLLIPVVFFILLEVLLRVSNYGHNLDQWTEVPGDKIILNPDVAYRYFYNTKGIPYSAGDAFDKVKHENTFRIFIIGESSAAGYPFSPNGSFAKYIRKRLRLINPDRKIEVINVSMAAINSYTLRDLFPGILEQKPDLIICYTGHNEYYGALGAGSAESLGNNRTIVNTMLYLNKFKTTQLVRDAIRSFMSLFSKESSSTGTLMSRMAKDQYIILNSDTYKAGIEQFKNNMEDIVNLSKEAGVPFVIGTLISNLKDQPPFVSVSQGSIPAAVDIFRQAETELERSNISEADSLFRYAKDLDALRFRAPEDINKIIRELAKENNIILADIDSEFRNIVPGSIIGDEFMTDHLHPTLSGYQKIGKLFFESMISSNVLPADTVFSGELQDSMVISDYDFTSLDSTIAKYRIITLKSDWPYVEQPKPVREILKEINAQNYVDTLALLVVDNKLDWERAHRKLAEYYLQQKYLGGFLGEMDALIDQYPFIPEYYMMVSRSLVDNLIFEFALPYLSGYYNLKPDAYSSKWIGIIQLSYARVKEAVKYLEISKTFNNSDPQVHYNLAGAYALDKQYDKALQQVNRALELQKNYPEAEDLKNQLLNITSSIEKEKTN